MLVIKLIYIPLPISFEIYQPHQDGYTILWELLLLPILGPGVLLPWTMFWPRFLRFYFDFSLEWDYLDLFNIFLEDPWFPPFEGLGGNL